MIKKTSSLFMLGYGAGNLSFALIFQLVATFLIFYATVILKLSPALVGNIVSLSVIFDAVTDPLMGYVSDHTLLKKLGRRHLYLIIGSVGAAISNFVLWTIPTNLDYQSKFIILTASLFLIKLFLTVYTTPYNALGTELTSDYSKRTTIQAYKTAFFILGFLFPSVIVMAIFFRPTLEYTSGQFNPQAYFNMGILTSVLTLVFAAVCFISTYKHIPKYSEKPIEKFRPAGVFSDTFNVLKKRDFLNIVLGYSFVNISSSLVSSAGMHVMTYTYKLATNKIAIIFGTLFAIAIVSQVAWTFIAKKRDKKYALILALIIAVIGTFGFLLTVFLRNSPDLCFYLLTFFAAIMGFAIGGALLLPYSMLSDTLDVEEYETGKRKEGIYFGIITFVYKCTQALIIFLLGRVLSMVGFDSQLSTQPESVGMLLGYILPVGFLLAFLPAIYFFSKYTLTEKKIRDIQIEIAKKRENNDNDEMDAGQY